MDKTQMLEKSPTHVAWLLVAEGVRRGRDYRLSSVTNIGRDEKLNTVIFDEDAVSAEHARVKYENGAYVLYDLASLNGTFLNGKKVQKAILRDEDRIKVGHEELIFKETKTA